MTKSVKAKKQKKIAKLKPILKLSRKLKKSQNESKTEFKARKIVIKEQLEDHPGATVVDNKNLSIKDLLSRLKHHNKLVKTDAIDRLREIIKTRETKLYESYVSSIIKGIGPCLLDLTSSVRKASVKCINTLIQMNRSEVQTFLGLLVSYASCAMVHIDVCVQEDSLYIIDSIRVMVPFMKTEMVNMLLSNFLGLITRKIKAGKSNATLIFNPDNLLTHVNWRAKLLSSLEKFLGMIIKHYEKSEKCNLTTHEIILRNCWPTNANAGNDVNLLEFFTSSEVAETFVKNIMGILNITWVETSLEIPKRNEKGFSQVEVYEIILNILNHLRNISMISESNDPTECDWYSTTINKKFQEKIIQDFPYSSTIQDEDDYLDVHSWNLNISIATLAMTQFQRKRDLKITIIEYFIGILKSDNRSKQYKMEKIVNVCLKLIEDDSNVQLKQQEELLAAALECFQLYGASSEAESYIKAREQLLALPVRAAEWECGGLRKSDILINWLKVLICESENDWPAVKNTLIELKLRNPPKFKETLIKFVG